MQNILKALIFVGSYIREFTVQHIYQSLQNQLFDIFDLSLIPSIGLSSWSFFSLLPIFARY